MPAKTTIAVPCWSSWNTGISRSSLSLLSTSKHLGADISSRLIPPNAGARVVGTGRSDFPNQVNNVIAFPGIFKGALEGRATQITEDMKLAAALAIANLIPDDEVSDVNILPEAFDPRVADVVANAVKEHIVK